MDHLEVGGPLLVYLESRALGPEQILPLEVALMNAPSRPLRSGADPHRWMLLDELNTHSVQDLVPEGRSPLPLRPPDMPCLYPPP